jgi:SAM-dependent methyltransferase
MLVALDEGRPAVGPGYDEVIASLRRSYDDAAAAERDACPKQEWKLAERAEFLRRLRAEGGRRLLEIGAGTGQDSLFFAANGLAVLATDLSPEMVRRCLAKGLDARVADFLHLDLPESSFDAVYALNCLLHVPNADLPAVLASIRDVLRPGGLFFVAVYGGEASEGPHETDHLVPPRFFSLRTDEQLRQFAEAVFDIEDFHIIEWESYRTQVLILRRPAA